MSPENQDHLPGSAARPTPDEIWTVLVEECGASEAGRAEYVAFATLNDRVPEYRFVGAMGFGGKLRHYVTGWYDRPEHRFSVDCYPEDRNDERDAMADRANERLRAMCRREAVNDA